MGGRSEGLLQICGGSGLTIMITEEPIVFPSWACNRHGVLLRKRNGESSTLGLGSLQAVAY